MIVSSAVPRGSGAFQMLTCAAVASNLSGEGSIFSNFLAPSTERQRGFSNAELSVVLRPSVSCQLFT